MTRKPCVARTLDALVAGLLSDFPAVMLVGPRASGKTTTAARLARSTFRLDRPADAAPILADPGQRGRSFFDLAFSGGLAKLSSAATPYDLRDYVHMALVGGFPDAALHHSEKRRASWLKSYVEQLLTHDAPMLGERRDPGLLRRYLRALAASTS